MDSRRILVIEDETELAQLVDLHLRDWGAEVTVVHDGGAGLEQATSGEYDFIVLDWMLPGIDGLTILQHVRQLHPSIPVLMLTARTSEIDRVLGLEVGADDYLTKPFSPRELVARVKAIFRRTSALRASKEKESADEAEAVHQAGALRVDPAKREATLSGRPLVLTAKEFDLLAQFASHPGRVYTRAELLDLVWGYGHDGYEHTVNSHINRLRSKLEDDPGDPQYILTVWGVGYKLALPA
ncbi:MAG: response regulator transcription factor [Acidobacteriota bacterium]